MARVEENAETRRDVADAEQTNDARHDGVTVDTSDGETPVGEVMVNLAEAHKDLEEYKNGALMMCAHLDEEILAARNQRNTELADRLKEVRHIAWLAYQRARLPDGELTES